MNEINDSYEEQKEEMMQTLVQGESVYVPIKIFAAIKEYFEEGKEESRIKLSPLHESSRAFISHSESKFFRVRAVEEYINLRHLWRSTAECPPSDDPSWIYLLLFVAPSYGGAFLGYFDHGKFKIKGDPLVLRPEDVVCWTKVTDLLPDLTTM